MSFGKLHVSFSLSTGTKFTFNALQDAARSAPEFGREWKAVQRGRHGMVSVNTFLVYEYTRTILFAQKYTCIGDANARVEACRVEF